MKKNKFIIYKALNKLTGKTYVGATANSIRQRSLDHTERAKRGEIGKFYEAMTTYGLENFSWTQVDTANSKNELATKEKEYITLFDSKNNGYNSDIGGGFKKTVYQYNVETGKLINSYDDLSSASNAVSATKTSISNACLNYNKTCKGYVWSYSKTIKPNEKIDLRNKKVCQTSLNGETKVIYKSVSEASRKTGISKTCIARCCRKEREHSGGFIWKYI
jgi:group I intron endonuclease